jgi:hypothetical protein
MNKMFIRVGIEVLSLLIAVLSVSGLGIDAAISQGEFTFGSAGLMAACLWAYYLTYVILILAYVASNQNMQCDAINLMVGVLFKSIAVILFTAFALAYLTLVTEVLVFVAVTGFVLSLAKTGAISQAANH